MKKRLTFIFCIVLIFTTLSTIPASATYNDEVEFRSNIVYVESLDRGTVIFDKNANKKTAEASITKITTAMVVLENCNDLNETVTATKAVLDTLAGTNSSTAGITAGEQLTVHQLLSLMLIRSANEAASILADYIGGSEEEFIVMMNDFAKARGCKNTHYSNPHGLDEEDHYSTAADIAKIIKYALKNETFCELVSQPSYTLAATNKRGESNHPNTNLLLNSNSSYYYEFCKGIKTGTTKNAGRCLASYAKKNGYTYLCIIIQAPYEDINGDGYPENFALIETKKAYEWVFNNIKLKIVAEPSDVVTVLDVDLARRVDHVRLVPNKKATALIPANVDASSVLIEPIAETLPKDLKAPVKAGDKLGKANIIYAGDILYTIDLVAGEDVKRSYTAYTWHLIKSFFSTSIMRAVLVLGGIVLLIYAVINILYANKKRKDRIHIVTTDHKGTPTKHAIRNPSHARKSGYKRHAKYKRNFKNIINKLKIKSKKSKKRRTRRR
ncbi:MAG: D-alanyl-D-alanine carboxypeptidase [Ruminococcaceae bacterium]|nr:D-alanyl-D-alanine carboxypeptidase [Oscillospiraceae bacterium]